MRLRQVVQELQIGGTSTGEAMPIPLFPPLFLWAMGALGAVAAAKVAVKEWRRVNAELDRAKAAKTGAEAEPVTELKRDPESGVFRPPSRG
jgi:hypothetical protein